VSEAFTLRLGFVHDPTPSPADTLTPDLPDATRLKFSAGVGYHCRCGIAADVGYQFVYLLPQRSLAYALPGQYSGTAHVAALTLAYHAPQPESTAAGSGHFAE
jgi:long-chain fatty acid transport protein